MEWSCEFGNCNKVATVHVGNSPVDRHYCDEHAEGGLRKYQAAQSPVELVDIGDGVKAHPVILAAILPDED
jgi:hypothetical protein